MNLNQLRQFYIFFLKGINKCLFPLGGKRQLSHLSSANLHWFRDSALGSQILLTGTIIRYQRETTGGKREQSLKQTPPHSQTEGGGHLSPVSEQADPPLAGGYDFFYLWRCVMYRLSETPPASTTVTWVHVLGHLIKKLSEQLNCYFEQFLVFNYKSCTLYIIADPFPKHTVSL